MGSVNGSNFRSKQVSCGSESEPEPQRILNLFEMERIAAANFSRDGGSWDADNFVDHHLRHNREAGLLTRWQRDSEQWGIDAIRGDEAEGDAAVRRVEQIGLHDNRRTRLARVGSSRGHNHDRAASYLHPVLSAARVVNATASRSDFRRLTSSD